MKDIGLSWGSASTGMGMFSYKVKSDPPTQPTGMLSPTSVQKDKKSTMPIPSMQSTGGSDISKSKSTMPGVAKKQTVKTRKMTTVTNPDLEDL